MPQLFDSFPKTTIHCQTQKCDSSQRHENKKEEDEKLCCKVSTGTHQTHWVLNNTKVTTKSTVSFLFPVHTGSCLFAWSRRRSCWGCVGRRRKSWRPSPVSTTALNPTPGPGSMTSSASSESAYWTSRRRRCGSSRNSCSLTNACARTQRWKKRLDLRDHSKTHPGFLFTFSYLCSTSKDMCMWTTQCVLIILVEVKLWCLTLLRRGTARRCPLVVIVILT